MCVTQRVCVRRACVSQKRVCTTGYVSEEGMRVVSQKRVCVTDLFDEGERVAFHIHTLYQDLRTHTGKRE